MEATIFVYRHFFHYLAQVLAFTGTCGTVYQSLGVHVDVGLQRNVFSDRENFCELGLDDVNDVAVACQCLLGTSAQERCLTKVQPDTHRAVDEVVDALLVGQFLADRDLCGVGIQDLNVLRCQEVVEDKTYRLLGLVVECLCF